MSVRASPADYLFLSPISKTCSLGNERCSGRLPISSPIPKKNLEIAKTYLLLPQM